MCRPRRELIRAEPIVIMKSCDKIEKKSICSDNDKLSLVNFKMMTTNYDSKNTKLKNLHHNKLYFHSK